MKIKNDGGIFCDLGKAFDYVNLNILLSICEFYGYRGKTNALIRSYLIDGYQRVLINNSSFNTTSFPQRNKIKHDVPRVSILCPYFFLIYMNDLLNIIAEPSKTILLADDTSIIITNPRPSKFKEDINNKIDNINDWFRGNSLLFNFDKTKVLSGPLEPIRLCYHCCP
jgi:hypothetical protein